jgi:hypothetical protein
MAIHRKYRVLMWRRTKKPCEGCGQLHPREITEGTVWARTMEEAIARAVKEGPPVIGPVYAALDKEG